MANLSSKIMNIAVDNDKLTKAVDCALSRESMTLKETLAYMYLQGHRDARHQACEVIQQVKNDFISSNKAEEIGG